MSKAKKRKKPVRNNAKAYFADYYMTGREYAKENEERAKDMPARWAKKSEITMLAAIIVAAVACVVKYVVLK